MHGTRKIVFERMSTRRNLTYRYLRAKAALNATLQKLLDINRRRHQTQEDDDVLTEEIKVLNATAKLQAHTLKVIDLQLKNSERA